MGRPDTAVGGDLERLRSPTNLGRPVAWLSTPLRVDDEVLFWRYLLAAIDRLGVRVLDLESSLAGGESQGDPWLTTLANRLGTVDGDPLIVLDDFTRSRVRRHTTPSMTCSNACQRPCTSSS